MQFRVLGTLEVLDGDGRGIDVGGAQPRAVLVMLLTAADRVVPADTIVDRLWPDGPPASAAGTLQSYISRLRRALDRPGSAASEPRALTWEARGYRLHPADDDLVDFVRFELLADQGRDRLAAGDHAGARSLLAEALDLWRGPAMVEFADLSWARGLATRLDERRLAAMEDRIRADLALGRHQLVVGELTDLVDQHPLREGLWEQLAIALYRSGRQAEALRAIDELRTQLVDGLGVDPSKRIRELESQILEQDPVLASPALAPAEPPPAPSPAVTTSTAQPVVAGDHLTDRIGAHFEGLTATELVGRQGEQQVLVDVLDAAARSITQWVVLEGEPGIGKTRLLEYLAHEATERGFTVMWGRSHESGSPPAFWPWLAALRGITDPGHPLPPPTQELLDRLLAPAGHDDFSPPVDASRFRLFEAIALLLQSSSRRAPLMIALDDLQWADPASLELIEYLTGTILGARVLFAATVRELEIGRNDEVVHALAQIARRPLSRRLGLSGLDRDEAAELARLSIGGEVSADVIAAINQRSEGNPFFIGELARLLASEDGLTQAELVRRAAVPAGVRDVLHRRLVRLPPATVELIQMAATIGRETSMSLLSRAAGVPLDQCIDDLDAAFVTHLVVEASDTPGTVRFSHALVREVVLDDMSVLRRSRLHLRVADAMEVGGPAADDVAEIVAEHLWQAVSLGVDERAALALERAAEVALRRFAYETADTYLERALQLRRNLPPQAADLNAELDSMNRLIVVRRVRYGFERARLASPIERAKQLARVTGRDLVLAELLWTEWAGAATACDFATSARLAEELVQLGASSEDPLIRATGHASWGIQCWHTGRIGEAMETLDLAVAELDSVPPDELMPAGPPGGLVENQLLTRGFHAIVHELAGQSLTSAPLVTLASKEADPYVQLVLSVCESVRALVEGDLAAAADAVRQAQRIEVGDLFEFFRSGAICLQGIVECMSGDPAAGIATITRGVDMYEANGVLTVMPFYLTMAAEGCVLLGDIEGARAWLARAVTVLEQTGELWEEPFVLCTTAVVLHAAGDPPEAVADLLRRAHSVAVEQGALGSARRVTEYAERLAVDIS